MYMPSIFNNSVFDNFDNWMDFSFPSFNQRLYGASSSQLMKTDVKETDKERYSGNVSRSFYVGENLEEKDIHAKFENGTLTLTFPKELEKKAVEEKHFVSIEG